MIIDKLLYQNFTHYCSHSWVPLCLTFVVNYAENLQ